MSKEDIEKAQKEAEAHADEDKKKREAVDARNTLENSIYQAEKMPKEYADKISDDDKKVIEEAVEEAKKHLESEDKEELEKAASELLEKIQGIGAKLYEAAAKEEAPAEDEAVDKDKDGPVEGEVVDDEKKKKGKK
jgi:molecular chaperone DnaK